MYYQNYEDYMRSVLGYPVQNDIYTYEDDYRTQDERYNNINKCTNEDMYPDIYKKLNPIVCKECDSYKGEITKEAVENIVEKIYSSIEMNNEINVININIENNRAVENRSIDSRNIDNRNRQRRPNNQLLRDLIRILVLNRLFRRPGNPPHRPPMRPPFPPPGRPDGYPMPTKPPMPRDIYDDYIK